METGIKEERGIGDGERKERWKNRRKTIYWGSENALVAFPGFPLPFAPALLPHTCRPG